MKLIISLITIGLLTIPIWIRSTYMILPKNKLYNDFIHKVNYKEKAKNVNRIYDLIGWN